MTIRDILHVRSPVDSSNIECKITFISYARVET